MKKEKENDPIDLRDYMGKGVSIKESKKSIEKRDEAFFENLLNGIINLEERTVSLLDYGIDIQDYEDPFHQIMEGLIYKCYGNENAEIIFWWIHKKLAGETKKLSAKIGGVEDYVVNTPKQLYKLLKKLDKLREKMSM